MADKGGFQRFTGCVKKLPFKIGIHESVKVDIFKEWIRDWLPSISIIGGAFWVFFRWTYAEFVKEMPSVGGELDLEATYIGTNVILLEIRGRWRNWSSRAIKIRTDNSIQIFSVDKAQFGLVDLEQEQPSYEVYPFEHFETLVLEPKTESLLKAYCIVPSGKIYITRWTLVQDKRLGQGVEWSKEALVDLR